MKTPARLAGQALDEAAVDEALRSLAGGRSRSLEVGGHSQSDQRSTGEQMLEDRRWRRARGTAARALCRRQEAEQTEWPELSQRFSGVLRVDVPVSQRGDGAIGPVACKDR